MKYYTIGVTDDITIVPFEDIRFDLRENELEWFSEIAIRNNKQLIIYNIYDSNDEN